MLSYSYLDPGIVLRYLCSRSTLENLGIRISQDYPEGFWPEILRVLLLGLSRDILVPIPSLENPGLRIRNSQDNPGINYRIFLRFSEEIQGILGLFSQGYKLSTGVIWKAPRHSRRPWMFIASNAFKYEVLADPFTVQGFWSNSKSIDML